MAKVTLVWPLPKPPELERVVLDLTPEEASVIHNLLYRNVCYDIPENTHAKVISDVAGKLDVILPKSLKEIYTHQYRFKASIGEY